MPWETPVLEDPMLKALMQEMPGVDDASLGAVSVEVDGASPHPGDDTGGSLRDLVMCCTSIGVPESATLGDAALAPGSSSPVGLGVSGLLLLGSLDFPPLHIDWRWVEDTLEFACSQVATAGRLLHEMLASVGCDILRLIHVSLRKERKVCLCASSFF
jgi:hypothetical protein